MKTSEVFKRVRAHLREYAPNRAFHTRYVCYALDYLYYQAKVIGDRDRLRCKRIVWALLDGAQTMEDWLHKKHGIKMTGTKRYRKKIHATRHAWMTHLIEHYQRKGD